MMWKTYGICHCIMPNYYPQQKQDKKVFMKSQRYNDVKGDSVL